MSFYETQATLPLHAPSYVERAADRELFEGLLGGQFCYVLTSRQMGKSSLMVRIAQKLRDRGCEVAITDLAAIGLNVTPEQWYDGLILKIGKALRMEGVLDDFWLDHERIGPVQRLFTALREVVLPALPRPRAEPLPGDATGKLVIFIDEIDLVRGLPFMPYEFFAAIRECYNARVTDPEYNRLTFALLGTATPAELIQDPVMTPFNIGRRIDLTDFASEEAVHLARGLGRPEPEASELLQKVLSWTNGHPYLTQRLCQALAADPLLDCPTDVDRLCEDLFLNHRARERDDNLLFVRENLRRAGADRSAVLRLYEDIRSRKQVPDDEANPLVSTLRLSGIVRAERGLLVVRNRIYFHVFDQDWIRLHASVTEVAASVAVLPFVDQSVAANAYLVDGLTDELINALGHVPGIRVASRSSIFEYKDRPVDVRKAVGQLKVSFVVEGNVRRLGSRLRISLRLFSVEKDGYVWSGEFRFSVDDLHRIQERIVPAIVQVLRPRYDSGSKPRPVTSDNVDAYQLYQKGVYYLNRRDEESLNRSLDFFEEAAGRDPESATAYAGIAHVCIILGMYNYRRPHDIYPRAKEAAIRALEISDDLADAHAALGCIQSVYDWDWTRAESSFRRATTLNPSYSTAHLWYGINCLTPLGRHEEALDELRQAQVVDPLSIRIPASIGLALHYAGRDNEAIAQFLHTLEMDANFWLTYNFLGCAYLQKQMILEAVAAFQASVRMSREDPGALAALAHAYGKQGRTSEAKKLLEQLLEMSRTRYVPACELATAYLGLRQLDQARDQMELAHQQREFRLIYLRIDPRFAELREDL